MYGAFSRSKDLILRAEQSVLLVSCSPVIHPVVAGEQRLMVQKPGGQETPQPCSTLPPHKEPLLDHS